MDNFEICCISFGFKHADAPAADIVIDVRFLDNPFYVPTLKDKSGLEQDVRNFVLKDDYAQVFFERLYAMLDCVIPPFQHKERKRLTVAFGCTGGRHRSVTAAETAAAHLRKQGFFVTVSHRDIDKK